MQVGHRVSSIQQLNHITKGVGMLIRQVVMDLTWRREANMGILGCHEFVETWKWVKLPTKHMKRDEGRRYESRQNKPISSHPVHPLQF